MTGRVASWRLRRLAVGVLAAGLIVTGGLTAVAFVLYDRNEDRLLDARVRELALVLSSAVPSIQTPLASAAALADATHGNPQRLRQLLAPYVGPGKQFVSISVWPLDSLHAAPTARFGAVPALVSDPARAAGLLAGVRHVHVLSVIGILRAGAQLRLGYAFATPNVRDGYAIYAESTIPADRRSKLSANSAFSDLDYVLYLGDTQRPDALVVTNLTRLPIDGRRASETVPFGDSALTLVVTPRGSLGGTFFETLPWIIAAGGVLLTIAATLLTDRLIRRRRRAEELAENLDRVADENRRLYAEQRGIADTLQHALLPAALPAVRGLTAAARYVPGASGVEIGGDWYDLVVRGDDSALIVVGDVAGRGIAAATTMASLRFAVLAYAHEGAGPGVLLDRLAHFADASGYGNFATVLCAAIDIPGHTVTIASAGHLPVLLITDGGAEYLPLDVGVPIGTRAGPDHGVVTASLPPGATLVAFTDGLVERRGEILDDGLERLRAVAGADRAAPLEDLLERLIERLPVAGGGDDDTAVLAVRWSG